MPDDKTEKMICDLKELITNAINLFMEKFEIVQNEIQNMNKRLGIIETRLDEHEKQQREDFKQVNQRLDKIEARFDEHEEQQRKDFEQVNQRLDKIEARFDEHEKQQRKDFEQVNQRLDKIEARFDEHEEQQRKDFEQVNQRFNQIETRFDKHEDKQRNDLLLLEHNLFERTGALFDAWKIDEDQAKEIKIKFSSIDNILEKHHYRIAALESNQN